LSTIATGAQAVPYKPYSHRQSFALVFACTILGAAAQMLMKKGMMPNNPSLLSYLTNIPLIAGYSLYGLSALLFTLALRDGELSRLYPVIALTYVWFTILSVPILHETINLYKVVGIATIVIGVGVLGKGQPR
jgi:uncharacterized membrane protein